MLTFFFVDLFIDQWSAIVLAAELLQRYAGFGGVLRAVAVFPERRRVAPPAAIAAGSIFSSPHFRSVQPHLQHHTHTRSRFPR